jgi:hypothetical protein
MIALRFWRQWIARKKMRSARIRPRLEVLEDRTLLSNDIVAENALAGTPQSTWDVTGGGSSNIVGFTDQISYNLGQTVNFKVNTTSTHYRLEIYRMGYYQGNGARLITTIDKTLTSPQNQPAPIVDSATHLQDFGNWGVSASWTIPTNLVSGIYFAKLVREDSTSGSNHVFFVVRNDTSTSDLLFQTSDTTWEAYNSYGGFSLYDGNPSTRAFAVSYNRPFVDRTTAGGFGTYDWIFHAEYPMVRWLEANGYDVTYFTHVDDAARGNLIKNHKAFLSVGHDEYWANEEYNAVKAARDAGVNLAFFSGDTAFWKTRWSNSIDGSNTPFRTLVCYKESQANAQIDPLDPTIWTGSWRDPRFSPPADGGRPENGLIGQMFQVDRGPTDLGSPLTVPGTFAKLRFWRNTAVANLQPDDSLALGTNTLGYEWDVDADNGFRPAGLMHLSSTTTNVTQLLLDYAIQTSPGTATHSLTLYRAPSGALVFSAGTVQWSWGLDSNHDDGSFPTNVAMQQATVNLLADMSAQPGSLQPGLIAATVSTDKAAPSSVVTLPSPGSILVANVPVTIYGTATDSGGGVVAGVEVSVDGGVTWHPASGRNSWTYVWTPNTNGPVTIKTRAVDDSGNLETPSAGVTVDTTGPLSLLNNQVTPDILAANDLAGTEVGVKFRSDVSGFVTGIRFYKGPNNIGTHAGSLWSSTGTKLGSATFTSESDSGWQTVTFSTPVAISANTTYVASYHTDVGHYSETPNYFKTTSNNGPLHVLGDGVSGPNGVYVHSASSAFPNQALTYSVNFWVDVLFSTSATSFPPPVIQTVTPVPANTGLSTKTTVTATFNESVVASSIVFVLKDPSGNPVAASVSYSDSTHTATLTPTALLAGNTTYTATISGAKDANGNQMPNPVSWSFTTGSPLLTIWSPTSAPVVAADIDNFAVEVGFKFRSDVAGSVTGIRFYKSTTNTGTHLGDLWSSTGTLLATATFTSETASSWQEVTFSTPVAISPNTTYVASYHTNVGHYADDANYFTAAVDSYPLHALKDGTDGPNGVYAYGASSTFPNLSFSASNYWVDVVFAPNASVLPTVISQTPGPGATNVATTTVAKAAFNESVVPSSISFVLKDASANPVSAAVAYDDTTHIATLTPSALLAPATTYTATVSGAKDSNGSVMNPTSWSFTTEAAPTITSQTPASGGTNVATSTPIKGVFNKSVVASSIAFVLKDAAGNAVGSTVAYDDVLHAVTLTPSALLAASTTYTATISGVKDASGNVMATTSWSFTTEAAPAVTSQTPAAGATNVTTITTVKAVFNKSVVASSISFVLKDAAGNPITATVAYDDPTRTVTLTPSVLLSVSSTYTATISGVKDSSGNVLASPVSWSFTTAANSGPFTLWSASTTPTVITDPDTNAVELGLKFRSDVAGSLAGVRFYKSASNTGTHVGNLWSSTGTLLATANFSGESASGWQQVNFGTPVAINANTTYVVSYHTNVGHYSADNNYFATTGVNNAPLHALAEGVDGHNGVYAYGASSAFPNQGATATNYWVDVVFVANVVVPTVISQTPAANAVNVATTSSVKAIFNESVVASSVTFTLKDPAGNPVTATLAYDEPSHSVTLTPAGLLSPSTTYTATISGAKDANGSVMTGPVSWSFTTEAAPSLTSQTPAASATNVATTTAVQATFNKAVVDNTILFTLKDPANNPVAGTVSYNATTNTVTFTPSAPLSVSTTFVATVSGAKDASGNVLATTSWSFTTEAAPAVSSQSPASGATNVATTSVVKATFNKSVVASSIALVLKDAAGNPVTASVAYDDTTHVATLTPAALLSVATTYTATLSGAKDTSGNILPAPVSWSFTTEAAPAVTNQSPTPGATGVANTSVIQATFNKSIVASSLAFVLKDAGGATVATTVTYDDPTHVATLTPAAPLPDSTTFTATVSAVKDPSGNVLASPVSWSFTTDVAPTVTAKSPVAGSTNVVTTSVVQATFSKSVVASTISFTLKDASGTTVTAALAYDDPSHTVTLTPSALLTPNTTYTATVSGAKDANGNVLAAPVSWSFTTEAAPALVSQTPAAGATNVVTTSTLQAAFSKAVQSSTISFTLKDAANNPVTGTVTYNATTNTATFTPSALLATATTFTATISGAKDASGNVMAPVSWSFTTEAAPTLTSQTPASGATNVVTTSVVKATFNKSVVASSIALVLKDSTGTTIASTVTYDDPTHMATLTPATPLNVATTYTATVSGAKDNSGNVMTTTSWSFTTEAAPAVTSQTPASGATNVVTTSTVQAVFNKAVQSSTISFTLKDAANNPVAGTVAYTATTNTATFTPNALLIVSTTYVATVSGAKDTSGNTMATATWSFTTEAAPAVTSTTPAAGATNVAVSSTVKAVFNKSVVASSISFGLKDAAGTTVTATLAYDNTTFTATLTPAAALAASTTYTATVSGAKDASGNVMTSPVSWSFTTAAATPAGLIAAYSFSEGTGTTVADLSGKGHTGTISNATWTTSGKYGNALSFNGTNALVTINDAADLDLTTGMTLEAWVQPTANATFWSAAIAKEQPSDPANDVAYALYTADGGSKPPSVHGLFGSGGGADKTAVGTSNLTLNTWVHLAGTYDGTALRLYVNGALVATKAQTGSMTATTGALRIGGDFSKEYFTGLIDEVRVYNRALSQTEIQTDMATPLASPPVITTQSPVAGATGVATTSVVKATFNKAVVASTISFTLKDAGGTAVPATLTYDATTFTATLTPSAALATSTTYTATVSGAQDSGGNVMAPVSWSFTTASSGSGPFSIWLATATPVNQADPDNQAVEVGVKFRADVGGQITGIRFFKGATNTGTHVGNLWTSTGTLLATATFSGETASGWQQVNFTTPVSITANTTYVASYHTNVGHYAADQNYFASAVDAPPLHALANGTDGPNGVFSYGSSSIFPTLTFNAANYWVDVVFKSGSGGAFIPPGEVTGPDNTLVDSGTNVASLMDSGTPSIQTDLIHAALVSTTGSNTNAATSGTTLSQNGEEASGALSFNRVVTISSSTTLGTDALTTSSLPDSISVLKAASPVPLDAGLGQLPLSLPGTKEEAPRNDFRSDSGSA